MQIQENILLAPYTTFHIGGPARYFCAPFSVEGIKQVVGFAKSKNLPIFVLGGGSNVLVSDAGFNGLVIDPQMKGLEIIDENESWVLLKLMPGQPWDKTVEYAVNNKWWGIENLSHIPGNCGGFAVQNVGAYGQEAAQVVEAVEALDMETLDVVNFSNPDCHFTYRHSIFNTSVKGRYLILSTTIKLSKIPKPNLEYGDVKKYFMDRKIESPSIKQIRQAITEIRDTKFPYPTEAKNGNAGSFFRGPVISTDQLKLIQEKVNQEFGAQASQRLEGMLDKLKVPQGYKTPTAFLMELCGLKGHQIGGAQINPAQPAIVLNATGLATAGDVLQLRDFVLDKVKATFGVELEVEPELVGF
jgi:UDP-N-acetylmuramate dehydrogenase